MKNAIKIYIRDLLAQVALLTYFPIPQDPINEVILSNYDDATVERYVKKIPILMLMPAILNRIVKWRL